ncbi:MAG TPA: hypothetical protein VK487_07875 [Candidatus Bathyarchaeia archaeon]|nr:hypothetical protein [Candidatus Bathyarchaeia archaeon]
MLKSEARKKIVVLLIVSISILLNLYTLVQAYPETFKIDSGCCGSQILAKDFSAYYTGAWRLFHDPSNIYTEGLLNDGQAPIYPQAPTLPPEPFKYLPSFLIFTSALLVFNYQEALIAFDIIQFLLLPVMAFLVYTLLKRRSILTIAIVIIIAILQPSPVPHWGLSVSYFWQWGEGQDKVLNTTLLLLSFYLGKGRKPVLSGVALALGAFDPRFFLLSLPLFIYYNSPYLKRAGLSLVASLAALNSPLLLDGIGIEFLRMVIERGPTTPLYYYALIPFLTLVSIMTVNIKEIYAVIKTLLSTMFKRSELTKPQLGKSGGQF